VSLEKKPKVLLQHNNSRPHRPGIREVITECECTILPHLLYSPIFALLDVHLFGPMKKNLCGKHFSNDGNVIVAVKKWLLKAASNFAGRGCRLCLIVENTCTTWS
jgi:hypothetical protein